MIKNGKAHAREIFLEALFCFIKGEEPEREKGGENQNEITRSLEDDNEVHHNFRLLR